MQAVRAHRWGGPEVLVVEDVEVPPVGAGEVRVRVTAFSLNLADVMATSSERIGRAFGLDLPTGIANDFAGIVDEIGEGVTGFAVGDHVFGGARHRAAAEHVVVTPPADGSPRGLTSDELYRSPDGLDDAVASTVQTAGLTADAAVTAVDLSASDTVLIGGAAGGVGVYAIQLARLAGARVIGTGSASTAGFLRGLGAEPVTYGEGLVDRVRALAPEGITAAIDLHGAETAHTALELGVPGRRIAAVASRDPELATTVTVTGALHAPADSSSRLARLLATGALTVPIAATFPLEDVTGAATALLARRTHGKIVVTPPR